MTIVALCPGQLYVLLGSVSSDAGVSACHGPRALPSLSTGLWLSATRVRRRCGHQKFGELGIDPRADGRSCCIPAAAALVLAGMNDVLNSQGYTQAAWRNRIPTSAWVLMFVMAMASCVLVGYGARSARKASLLLMVLPLVISLSLYLIADIDSPRTDPSESRR